MKRIAWKLKMSFCAANFAFAAFLFVTDGHAQCPVSCSGTGNEVAGSSSGSTSFGVQGTNTGSGGAASFTNDSTTTATVTATDTASVESGGTQIAISGTANGVGVYGDGSPGYGVEGVGYTGVYGSVSSSSGSDGVYGQYTSGGTGGQNGVHGQSNASGGSGVYGNNKGGGYGVAGTCSGGTGCLAVFSIGDEDVSGSLSKTSGSFKIDHPLDPRNKYLFHSFVESPDMKNIYDGVADLDIHGEAVVELPNWFESLNDSFRYQLTSLGGFQSLYVAEEVHNNRFKISGGNPHGRVSWQVTGIRHDAWAQAHRIQVEV
jgi:hypothetical protein